jgi:RNA polymerase sigma-70 factor, ECF subfamily
MPAHPASDIQSILQRIAAGEVAAYATIVNRFQGPLFGYLGRMGLRQALAEELAQETFLRAWRSLNAYRADKAAFSTWLFAIARNLAIDELNRSAQRFEISGCDESLLDPASDSPQPPELVQAAQQSRQLQAALRQLPMADRSALALVYSHELDLAQVARIEGCTSGAIKVRLHRARARLRELMEHTDGANR